MPAIHGSPSMFNLKTFTCRRCPEPRPFSVRGFFSHRLWVKSYILYLLLGNVVVKLYFYLENLYTEDHGINSWVKPGLKSQSKK